MLTKTRKEKVAAQHGGEECPGVHTIEESCNVQECPGNYKILQIENILLLILIKGIVLKDDVNQNVF